MMASAEPLVLVVDDYQDAREMYAEYFKASGFRVAEARTGIEAVAKARELLPDCILMDLSLPGIDGWEATRQLKADQTPRRSPSWRSPATPLSWPRAMPERLAVLPMCSSPPSPTPWSRKYARPSPSFELLLPDQFLM